MPGTLLSATEVLKHGFQLSIFVFGTECVDTLYAVGVLLVSPPNTQRSLVNYGIDGQSERNTTTGRWQ
jgi:hypothetical protein